MIKEMINDKYLEKAALKDSFTIECKDIILREFRLEDLDELHALTQQHEITDFVTDWGMPKEEFKNWISNNVINDNEEFFKNVSNIKSHILRLGIILKETNEFIGWCCTGPCDELPLPNREIGYAISKYHRNKGNTTQAVQGLIKYLFEETNVEFLNTIALTHNISSNRVIEKCGFSYVNNIKIGNREFYHYMLSKNK